jgi:ATP-dependent DNA helicase RecQ
MAEYLPQSPEELIKISGFGKARLESYGPQFLKIIQQYCKEYNLLSRIAEKSPKRQRKETTGLKEPKIDTKAETYKLYKEGIPVNDIAKTRNLTIQTIEGHLAYYVQRGEINIEELISQEKLMLIEPVIKDFNGGSITSVKEQLGNTISFGEIRLVIASSVFKNSIKA